MYGKPQQQQQQGQQPTENINLYIPGNVVGSIIGSKGANAKELHQNTGARIKVGSYYNAAFKITLIFSLMRAINCTDIQHY